MAQGTTDSGGLWSAVAGSVKNAMEIFNPKESHTFFKGNQISISRLLDPSIREEEKRRAKLAQQAEEYDQLKTRDEMGNLFFGLAQKIQESGNSPNATRDQLISDYGASYQEATQASQRYANQAADAHAAAMAASAAAGNQPTNKSGDLIVNPLFRGATAEKIGTVGAAIGQAEATGAISLKNQKAGQEHQARLTRGNQSHQDSLIRNRPSDAENIYAKIEGELGKPSPNQGKIKMWGMQLNKELAQSGGGVTMFDPTTGGFVQAGSAADALLIGDTVTARKWNDKRIAANEGLALFDEMEAALKRSPEGVGLRGSVKGRVQAVLDQVMPGVSSRVSAIIESRSTMNMDPRDTARGEVAFEESSLGQEFFNPDIPEMRRLAIAIAYTKASAREGGRLSESDVNFALNEVLGAGGLDSLFSSPSTIATLIASNRREFERTLKGANEFRDARPQQAPSPFEGIFGDIMAEPSKPAPGGLTDSEYAEVETIVNAYLTPDKSGIDLVKFEKQPPEVQEQIMAAFELMMGGSQ